MAGGLKRTRHGILALAAVTLVWGALLPSSARPAPEKAVDLNKAVTLTLEPDVFDPMNQSGKSSKVRRGAVVRLVIKGTVAEGAYTYPLTLPQGQPPSANLSSLTTRVDPGLLPLPPVSETPPEVGANKDGPYAKYTKPFAWGVDIFVKPDAPPGPRKVEVDIRSTACNESQCVPFVRKLATVIDVSSEPAEEPSESLVERVKAAPPPEPITTAAAPGAKADGQVGPSAYVPADLEASLERVRPQLRGSVTPVGEEESGLIAFILAGMFWGAVSLITPCVFPMIPITVSYFLKQSEKEHHRPIAMASVYCLTIVIVLTIAAVALLNFFRFLSVNPIMNLGLGLLFVFFALSLFGMYEIELPSGLARFTSSREGAGGMLGTVFMALTFTIISFACVAPFLGGFGGTAALTERPWWHTILGALAFSATFASPFFLLALFPALLKRMPKSGSWLNTVKVVMGFLELAAALNFFRTAELVLSPTPSFFTYDFVLGCYIVLSGLCGLYLLGAFRLPHDTPADHLSVPRLMFSFLFLAFAVYLLPGLFTYNAEGDRVRPTGTVYAWVNAFLLPDARPTAKGGEAWGGNLEYAVEKAREHRRKTGKAKLVFVDFTGVTCKNCKLNEEHVFSKPEVQKLFQPYDLVQMYTDTVPNKFYSPEAQARFGSSVRQQQADADVIRDFQSKVFNDTKLPLYAILEPRLDNTVHIVGVYREGRIMDEPGFQAFLRNPVQTLGASAVAQTGR